MVTRGTRILANACVLTLLSVAAGYTSAKAETKLFTGTDGTRSAVAAFEYSGGSNFTMLVTNDSPYDGKDETYMISAIFFNVKNNPTINMTAADVAPGSDLYAFDAWKEGKGPTAINHPAGVITPAPSLMADGHWQFVDKTIGMPYGTRYGVGGAGFTIFGSGADGSDYCITQAGDITRGNSGVKDPVVRGSALFTFSGVPTGFTLNNITDVYFQYGTDINDNHLQGTPPAAPVPEPAFMQLGSLILMGGIAGFKRLRKA